MYRYSDRLDWNAPTNAFTALLAEEKASGRTLLDLTVSNPTEALKDYPHAEIAGALGALPNLVYEPEPFGWIESRRAIVRHMRRRVPGVAIDAGQVALTASTSEAYAMLFKLLANPGDEVLAPTPSYPLFDYLGHLEGVKLSPYRLAFDGSWFIDFASLEAAVTARTRAVILVNPNNPTGSFLKREEYDRLSEFAWRQKLPLISDEVFMDYAFEEAEQRVKTLTGRNEVLSFALNGLSKSAGMPQMKLGWMVVNGPQAEREAACTRLELILDTYLSVGTPVQLAAPRLLEIGDGIQDKIRQRISENLNALREAVAGSPVHMLHSEGGWSGVLRVPGVLSEEQWITRLLKEYGTVVQPGYFFDMPDEALLVVSLLTAEPTFAAGCARLMALAKTL